jgi:hypothetical protein
MPSVNQWKNVNFVKIVFFCPIKYILGKNEYKIWLECLPWLICLKVCLLDLTYKSTSNTALKTTGKNVNMRLNNVIGHDDQNELPDPL